jgi:hypothetical protein
MDATPRLVESADAFAAAARCFTSLKKTSKSKKTSKPTKRDLALAAMQEGSEQELREMIRRQLALPMNQRTHFLRLRLPNGGSRL